MIVYDLGCENHHRFEGWFASIEDYERQFSEKSLNCPMCGNASIKRLPHATHVSTGVSSGRAQNALRKPASASSPQYSNLGNEMLARLIDHVIENTDDVGAAFPEEARKIHYQEAPERHIRGTASARDVEALKDEGIDVVALPVPPSRAGRIH